MLGTYLDESTTIRRASARNLDTVYAVTITCTSRVLAGFNAELGHQIWVDTTSVSTIITPTVVLRSTFGRGWCRGIRAILDRLLLSQECGGGSWTSNTRTIEVLECNKGRLHSGQL